MTKTNAKTAGRPARKSERRTGGSAAIARARGGGRGPSRWTIAGVTLVVAFALVVLFMVYRSSQGGTEAADGGSGFKHAVGDPGIGATAPDFTLPAAGGGEVSLSDYRGRSVLLYFQEGLMCQPCFDQITDLEANADALHAAGVDEIVSISTDPAGQLARKVTDMKLSTPALSDPDLTVIRQYDAHKYGMMDEKMAGHSFVLIGPDGTIQWRADYGGKPDYTMFLPTEKMLADLNAERIG